MNTIYRALFRTWAPALVLSFSTALADGTPLTVEYQSDSKVPYLTGGVGRDQRDALLTQAKDHNLRLIFAEESPQAHRAFVSQVSVRIFNDAGREILRAEDAGPWLFTTLPSGKYRVEAALRGKTVVKTIDVVAERRTQVAFFW